MLNKNEARQRRARKTRAKIAEQKIGSFGDYIAPICTFMLR